jgi:hypothetical protein
MKIDSSVTRRPSNAGMRKRRTCFEQTLPEDCEDFFRKVGDFGRKSVAGIRFCAMHQYGASVSSISANN